MTPREFDKVDRELELQVIDWLDWLEWGKLEEHRSNPSMPALALDLIAKRKAAYEQLTDEFRDLEHERDKLQATISQLKESEAQLKAERDDYRKTIKLQSAEVERLTKELESKT